MILHDNNVTAAPVEHFTKFLDDATIAGVTVDFRQGLDCRLFTDEHAAAIAHSRYADKIHFAFDHVVDERFVRRAMRLLKEARINTRSRAVFYVLVGFDTAPEEDMYRIELLRDLDANPFVMPYDRNSPYQRRLARWVNRPQLFRAVPFAEFDVTR